jgi:hypothetical protein
MGEMATWNDLAGYLRTNYKIRDDQGSHLILLFGTTETRSQIVHVSHGTMGASQGDWAIIASVFGKASEIDLGVALQEAAEYVVGGVALFGDALVMRHAVPLANLDINEFEEPLHLVLGAADAMEERFTGRDDN